MSEHESQENPSPRLSRWRKSSYSANGADCVEIATLTDGTIAVRNSHHPDRGTATFTVAEMAAWIEGIKAGEFDDLV